MNLEECVTSLHLSKKLLEIGLREKNIFSWHKCKEWNLEYYYQGEYYTESYAAFTAEELLSILPHIISTNYKNILKHYRFNMTCSLIAVENDPATFKVNFIINYIDSEIPIINDNGEYEWPLFPNKLMHPNIYHHKLCDTLALTYIYLKEKGLINDT